MNMAPKEIGNVVVLIPTKRPFFDVKNDCRTGEDDSHPSGDHKRARLQLQRHQTHDTRFQATAKGFIEDESEVERRSMDSFAQEPHGHEVEESGPSGAEDSEYFPDEDESDGDDTRTKKKPYRKPSTNIPKPVLNLCSIPQGPGKQSVLPLPPLLLLTWWMNAAIVPLPRFLFRAYGQHSRGHLQAEGAPFADSTVYGPRIDDTRMFPIIRNHVEYWKANPSPLISTTPFLIWVRDVTFEYTIFG